MKKKKKKFKLLKEFFMLTTSVLLAFLLSSWNETRKEKHLAELYLEGIFEEINSNKNQLDTILPYHKSLIESLNTDAANTKLNLKIPKISNEAWNLSENEIFKKHVDRDLYKRIANAYNEHEILMNHCRYAGHQMSTLNIFSTYLEIPVVLSDPTKEQKNSFKTASKRGWLYVMYDWVNYEEDYLNSLIDIQESRWFNIEIPNNQN